MTTFQAFGWTVNFCKTRPRQMPDPEAAEARRGAAYRVHEYLVASGWRPSESGNFWVDPWQPTMTIMTRDAFGMQGARDAAALSP